MKTDHRKQDEIDIVEVSGVVDLDSSPGFREKLQELTRNRSKTIIVEMSGIDYIDSSGIATLVECYQILRTYNGSLYLAGMTPEIMEVFTLARLHRVFTILETLDEAIEAAKGENQG